MKTVNLKPLTKAIGEENVHQLIGGLRVAEAFVGQTLRWLHQPDDFMPANHNDALRCAERGINDALKALGFPGEGPTEQHPPAYFAALHKDDSG